MKIMTAESLQQYLDDDPIAILLDQHSAADDEQLVVQRWLRSDPSRRAVTWMVYGDLFQTEGLRVLDVGAGLSGLQRGLGERHDYTVVDMLVHDSTQAARCFAKDAPRVTLIDSDWSALNLANRFDVIVSNDLFPNVDQRLIAFLEWSSLMSDRLVISLTYFLRPRAYAAKRLDADEILHVASWSAAQIEACEGTAGWNGLAFPDGIEPYPQSVFENGRNIAVTDLSRVVA